MIFDCEMKDIIRLTIRANSPNQAQEWIDTHTIEEVKKIANGFVESFEDSVQEVAGKSYDLDLTRED